MADAEEAPPPEYAAAPADEPPAEEAGPPPADDDEAPPPIEEPPPIDGDAPPPPEEAGGEGPPHEDLPPESEGQGQPAEELGTATKPPSTTGQLADLQQEPDYMHDPEIEVLEADGMIEEVHVLEPSPPREDEQILDDEGSFEGSLHGREEDKMPSIIEVMKERRVSMAEINEDVVDEVTHLERSKSGFDDLRGESSLDVVTKKELLEKKKQRVLGSVISIRRGDPTYFGWQKAPKFQNSFKLDSDKGFNSEKVKQILEEVLDEALNELTYDPDKCSKQAKWASSAIRAKVKEQEYDRYKIICYVSIGEKLCQDVFVLLRFLWDSDRDRFAMHVHENMNLFGIGICFGIYYE